jgi:ferredoxin/flavodoxin---NADP+ reductase
MRGSMPPPPAGAPGLTARGVEVIEWFGWEVLDTYEQSLGEPHGRERIKGVPREQMIAVSLGRTPLTA